MYKLTKTALSLILIVIFSISLRVWKLPEYPIQLNHDEVSQVYDAISIAQTGKDIYGNFLPTIFPSVNDFKSPFYTYATVLVYLLIGNHEWLIRVVGVIFGILLIPAVFYFTLKLTKQPKMALFSSLFAAISPAEIFFSRKSFENGAGIFFLIVAASFIMKYLENQQKVRWLYLSVIFSGLGMYTYFSHVIIIPLMTAVFVLLFRKEIKFRYNKFLPAIFLWVIIIIPILLIIWTNPGARFRSQSVFVSQDRDLGELVGITNYRNPITSGVWRLKATVDFSFNRYIEQFDPIFLFGNGLDLTNQGPLNSGPLLFMQLPFILMGIFYLSLRSDLHKSGKLLALWIALGTLPSGLTFEPHSPHRMIIVFTLFNIISGVGAFFIWQKIKGFSGGFRLTSILILTITLMVNLLFFLHIYFVNYPYEKSQYIQYPFKQVAQFAWSQYDNFDQIVFDPLFGEQAPFIGTAAHYYLAYFGNYPPSKFQKQYKIGSKEREVIFDKFSIRKIDWRIDQDSKRTLFIGSSWSLPIDSIDKNKIIHTFYFYNHQPAFYAIQL